MSARAGAKLRVFLNQELLGGIERRGPSRYRFTYADDALERHGEGAPVLRSAERWRDRAAAEGWHRPTIDAIVDVCRERTAQLTSS